MRNRKGDERENQGDTYPESLMTEEEEDKNVVSFARRRLNKQKGVPARVERERANESLRTMRARERPFSFI